MKAPKMILFDYGQTLISESPYDVKKSFEKLISLSVTKLSANAEELCAMYDDFRRQMHIDEFSNQEPVIRYFFRYMCEMCDMSYNFGYEEFERIFWEEAVSFAPTPGIEDFLSELEAMGIRSAVISNIDYSENTLKHIINTYLPSNHFEFVIATSEYCYRKPFGHIFRLALKKAGIVAEDAWYVGNDARCDVEGPVRAGLAGIWYQGSPYFKEQTPPKCPHTAVSSWSELTNMIRKNL